jgi:uncharacterized repeat protein (TIGR02543 family)
MAAPSSTIWGNIVTGDKSTRNGRIGIYTGVTTSNTSVTVKVQVWFWSMYSIDDTNNKYYYDAGASTATTLIGKVNINHTVATGSGWSTSNQTKLGESTYTYTRGTSASTKQYAAKFTGIDSVGSSNVMSVTTSVTVPALTKYTISYNANGGSGAPSSQTKWYGTAITLSGTKPTRTGYTFQGWATYASGSVVYSAGSSYTANASATLYAVWKAVTYAVNYNANGGSGAPSAQSKTYGVNLTLSNVSPTRSDYNFKGWSTSASSTAVSYLPGGTYKTNAAVTLYAVWELAYVKPRIDNLSVSRCNSEGTVQDDGTYALVIFDWECDKTVTSIAIECLYGESSVDDERIASSGTSGSVSKIVGDGLLSADQTYTIRITVTDSGGSFDRSKTLNGMEFTIDGLAGGKGVAFGKPAEVEGYADFAYKILTVNNQAMFARNPDGVIVEALNPQNGNGNTVLGWGNYENKVGNTNVYGYDVNFGVSNIADPGTFRPYRRQGDTMTFTLRTAGYVTNAGKDVTFLVPFAVPIVGAPTATVASIQGFVLRQGNKYTHGSSSSVYVTPDSYVAAVSMFCGVYITAKFSDTTNVINNDSIGIYWNGTITFS